MYGTRSFITEFTRAGHLHLGQCTSIQYNTQFYLLITSFNIIHSSTSKFSKYSLFLWFPLLLNPTSNSPLEMCVFMRYYAAYSGNSLSIGCPETSVRKYHYTLRNIPEKNRSLLLRGGSLVSRNTSLPPFVPRA